MDTSAKKHIANRLGDTIYSLEISAKHNCYQNDPEFLELISYIKNLHASLINSALPEIRRSDGDTV